MKTRVTLDDFVQAFKDHGRESQFSRPALYGLFNYLEQYEEDTGEDVDLDVIALCCDYTEADYKDIADDYGIDVSECADVEDMREAVLNHLQDETLVVWYDDESVLFANF
jgi:hypothetical protein